MSDGLHSAMAAWALDCAAGSESLLLAVSNATVTELNTRARAARLLTSGNPAPPEIRLRDGTGASVGDLILARHNDRRLRFTGPESVKNGNRFTVLVLADDGGLLVRHPPSRHCLTLPAGYVAEVGGRLEFGTPKTHQHRSVPLPATLAEPLARRCEGKQPDDPLMTPSSGTVLRLRTGVEPSSIRPYARPA